MKCGMGEAAIIMGIGFVMGVIDTLAVLTMLGRL